MLLCRSVIQSSPISIVPATLTVVNGPKMILYTGWPITCTHSQAGNISVTAPPSALISNQDLSPSQMEIYNGPPDQGPTSTSV